MLLSILAKQRETRNKQSQIMEMLGFIKAMDKYSQRAHDFSSKIAQDLESLKYHISPAQKENLDIPKVHTVSKVIAQPYRDFEPRLDKLSSKIVKLKQSQGQGSKTKIDMYNGFFGRYNRLKEKLVYMDGSLFKKVVKKDDVKEASQKKKEPIQLVMIDPKIDEEAQVFSIEETKVSRPKPLKIVPVQIELDEEPEIEIAYFTIEKTPSPKRSLTPEPQLPVPATVEFVPEPKIEVIEEINIPEPEAAAPEPPINTQEPAETELPKEEEQAQAQPVIEEPLPVQNIVDTSKDPENTDQKVEPVPLPPVVEPVQEEAKKKVVQPIVMPPPTEAEEGFPSLQALLGAKEEEFKDLVGKRADYEKEVLGIDENLVARPDDFVLPVGQVEIINGQKTDVVVDVDVVIAGEGTV